MRPTLDFIKEIALHAGEILMDYFGKELDVQHKSRTDLVTNADHAAEDYLIETIRKAFPEHGINAEESGEWEGSAEYQWYIDPLDGTLNYAHGVPVFAVSIGFAQAGQMQAGVVYDPVLGEFFCGVLGEGATLNGNPIHVSSHTDLLDCMLATGFPADVCDTPYDNVDNFRAFCKSSQTIRRMGSAALDIVYVAAGRIDGYWKSEVFPWDIAAGGLIVREAGGVVTNVFDEPDYMKKPISLVCANPGIHAQMIAILEKVREERHKDK